MHYLYRIVNLKNGKVYIGQTDNPNSRWLNHKNRVKNKTSKQYIHLSMAKHGVENFIFEVIATCRSQEDTDEIEKFLIIQYNSRDKNYGYNLSPGGDISWNKGKTLPEAWRNKISEAHKGKIMPEVTRIAISKANKGRHLTEEHKRSISNTHGKNQFMKGVNVGEKSGQAKLTWEIVSQIRREFLAGGVSKSELARKYGVSQPSIKNIIMNITWKV